MALPGNHGELKPGGHFKIFGSIGIQRGVVCGGCWIGGDNKMAGGISAQAHKPGACGKGRALCAGSAKG